MKPTIIFLFYRKCKVISHLRDMIGSSIKFISILIPPLKISLEIAFVYVLISDWPFSPIICFLILFIYVY